MWDDLDELLIAYLSHYEELSKADYFFEGSSEHYYRLRAEFENKYDTTKYDVRASGHWDAPV